MNFVRPLGLAASLLVLAGCASDPGRGPGGRGGNGPGGVSGFDRASAALAAGNYATAHAGFLCIAQQGPGYEIALHSAGLASLAQADGPEQTGAGADALTERGMLELIDAANAGWPASQAELVSIFHARGDAAALDRAAFWLAVLDLNTRDRSLGLERIPAEQRAVIEADLGAARLMHGQAEASQFSLTPLERQPSSQACAPWTREAGGGRGAQSGERQRRGGGRGPGGGSRGGGGGRGGGSPF